MPGRRLFPRYQFSKRPFSAPLATSAQTKRTTGTADGPKSAEFFSHSRCQLAADRLAAAAGLMLALHWPFGPWLWTLCLEDVGPVGRLSPLALVVIALVTVGAGRCEKPLDQPSNPTLDKGAGSFMKGLSGTKHRSLARPPRCGRVTGGDPVWPQRRYMAALERISPKLRTILATHPAFSGSWIGVIGVGNSGLADNYRRRARLRSAQGA